MPWWIVVYITIYCLLLTMNAVFWLKCKGAFMVLTYEILAGVYLMGFVVAFWYIEIRQFLSVFCLPGILMIILLDFYLSIYGKREDFGLELENVGDAEFEMAKILSVVFAAPAYVISVLTAIQLV